MILPPVGRWQKLVMTVAVPGPWIAERIRAEALRNRIGKQAPMLGKTGASATDLRIGAKHFGIRHRQELLSGRGGGHSQQSRQ